MSKSSSVATEKSTGMKELGLHILSKRIILRLVKNKEVQ